MAKGMFVVIEGLDGAGTTTQARQLADWFDKEGQPIVLTREPSDGPAGFLIRLALTRRLFAVVNDEVRKMDDATLALMFAADRMDHVHTTIDPKLEQGVNVVSDRYYLSSFAYQSLGVELAWVRQINSKCTEPDLTVLLDVPPLVCARRMAKERWQLNLYEDATQLEEIRANYLQITKLLAREGHRVVVLDANRPARDVHRDIKKLVRKLQRGTLTVPADQSLLFELAEE